MKNKTIAAVAKNAGENLNVITEMHISKWLSRNMPCHDMLVSVSIPSDSGDVVCGVDCGAWALYTNLSDEVSVNKDSQVSLSNLLGEAKSSGLDKVNLPLDVVLREMALSGAIDKLSYLVLFDPDDFDARVDDTDKFNDPVPVLSLGSELVVMDDCFKMASGSDEILFGYNKNGLYLAV